MAFDLSEILVVAISSRALFELGFENKIFEQKGLIEYSEYQRKNETKPLPKGAAFPLIEALLHLNTYISGNQLSEVVIVSRNNADTGLRIFNSVKHYGLDITRAAFTSGEPVAKYLKAFNVDLFLSASEQDVRNATENIDVAAGLIYENSDASTAPIEQIRIAFDGDAVLFSEESERIYQEHGLDAFLQHEKENANKPLPEGPFAKLLRTLSYLQNKLPGLSYPPIKTALVTARNSPAHERVIRTLRAWNIRIDEAFFLGGVPKGEILKSFKPHIFFDDHPIHCDNASPHVPVAQVLTTLKRA